MKNLLKIAVILFAVTIIQSCSSSSSPAPAAPAATTAQISVDGQAYSLLPQNAVIELKMNNLNIQGQLYNRSAISINAITGTTVAVVNFDLFYKAGLLVAGTYNIDQTIDNSSDFYANLLVAQKLCLGWTSMCVVTQAGSQTALVRANNPVGTIKVINNGNNNYTIQYNGNFKKYNNNFQIVGYVPVVIDITSTIVSN